MKYVLIFLKFENNTSLFYIMPFYCHDRKKDIVNKKETQNQIFLSNTEYFEQTELDEDSNILDN